MSIKTIKGIANPDDEFLQIPQWLKEYANKKDKTQPIIEEAPKIVVPALPLSPKQLKKKRHKELMSFLACLVDTGLKKKPLIAKMRDKFPKLSSAQICRFINNQLKSRVIEIDKTFKTKPIIIKGKYWRSL